MALTTESALRKDKRDASGDLNGTLQHRHFAVIAGILAEALQDMGADTDGAEVVRDMALKFANKLAGTNRNFDRARFLRACGIVAVDINWEDSDMTCANCDASIESAYGED